MSAVVLAVLPGGVGGLLAQAPPGGPGGGRGEEFGKASPIALVVVLLLGVATFLLIRSMNRRLRNVPTSFDTASFDADGSTTADPAADVPNGPDGAGSDGSGTSARPDGAPPAGSL